MGNSFLVQMDSQGHNARTCVMIPLIVLDTPTTLGQIGARTLTVVVPLNLEVAVPTHLNHGKSSQVHLVSYM